MDPAAVLSLADHVIPLSAAIHWPETVGCGLPDAPYPAPRNQALGSPGMLACTVHTRAVEGRAPPRQSKGATGFL